MPKLVTTRDVYLKDRAGVLARKLGTITREKGLPYKGGPLTLHIPEQSEFSDWTEIHFGWAYVSGVMDGRIGAGAVLTVDEKTAKKLKKLEGFKKA